MIYTLQLSLKFLFKTTILTRYCYLLTSKYYSSHKYRFYCAIKFSLNCEQSETTASSKVYIFFNETKDSLIECSCYELKYDRE